MVVDCHVHTRDCKQKEKETVEHALQVAKRAGVSGIFGMPNTNPTLDTKERVKDYLSLANQSNVKDVFFGVYMALTRDPEQIKRAVETYNEFFPSVVGFKLYMGHSVGEIGVIDVTDQLTVYSTLADLDYRGIVANHCEKESLMDNSKFDRNNPLTHATIARPIRAEEASIRDLIYLVEMTEFKGKIHVAHISSPTGVELVNSAKKEKGLDISCGVCPHHIIYDWDQMKSENGVLWKMNPPLRAPGIPNIMLEYVRQEKIDWIETDHAPHGYDDKIGNNEKGECASGIPALHAWPLIIEYLRLKNFTENQIEGVTHKNIVDRFGIPIDNNNKNRIYSPNEYSFNPWGPLERMLNH